MSIEYTPRVTTEDNGNIVAWVDSNGAVCIKQVFNPESGDNSPWESEEQAMLWASTHAETLALQGESVDRLQVIEKKDGSDSIYARKAIVSQK